MSEDLAILARMRQAQVPPHAFDKTLKTLRQIPFAHVIATKAFDLGEGGLKSYLVTTARAATHAPTASAKEAIAMVCAVAAKELVLRSRKAVYTSIAELVHRSRREDEGAFKGYVIVGDVGENVSHWSASEWDTVQMHLLSHLAKGGGLILGDTGVIFHGSFNADFCNALTLFEQVYHV